MIWLTRVQAGRHILQMKTAETFEGRARELEQPEKQRQYMSPAKAVRLAAPGIARLTADEDGLLVHHCLANRRDLHAEYPPGAAPAADDAAPGAEGGPMGSSERDQPGQHSVSVEDISRGIGLVEQQHADLLMASGGAHADELTTAEDGEAAAASTMPGLLRFPWECGPLLEALLHEPTSLQETSGLGRDALPPITIEDLPAPEPDCGVGIRDVIDALISEGVLVAA